MALLQTLHRSIKRRPPAVHVSSLEDRLDALEIFSNNSPPPTIRSILDNIQGRLDGIEAGMQHLPKTAQTQDEVQNLSDRKYHEAYTYQSGDYSDFMP